MSLSIILTTVGRDAEESGRLLGREITGRAHDNGSITCSEGLEDLCESFGDRIGQVNRLPITTDHPRTAADPTEGLPDSILFLGRQSDHPADLIPQTKETNTAMLGASKSGSVALWPIDVTAMLSRPHLTRASCRTTTSSTTSGTTLNATPAG